MSRERDYVGKPSIERGTKIGAARLYPVCGASNVNFANYGGSGTKDADNRAACPECGKAVKLRKQGLDRWPNTIPHHHTPPPWKAPIGVVNR